MHGKPRGHLVWLVALLTLGCEVEQTISCAEGTVREGTRCVREPTSGAGQSGLADLADAAPPRVTAFGVTSLKSAVVTGAAPHVGYPLRIDARFEVTGEPFKADIYFGLVDAKGTRCVLGTAPLVHQPKAFELADAALQARLQAPQTPPVGSSRDACDPAKESPCSDGEVCTGLDADGRVLPAATGVSLDEVVASDSAAQQVVAAVAQAHAETAATHVCMAPADAAFALDNQRPIDARDFGGAASATLEARAELPIQAHCAALVDREVRVWVAFDPFQHLIWTERPDTTELAGASLDFKTGAAFIAQSEAAAPDCPGASAPGVCPIGKLAKNPGTDLHLRALHVGSSVLIPAREKASAGHIDINVQLESSIYGTPDKETREALLDEDVDIAFALTATGDPIAGCDASAWDGEPRPVSVVVLTEAKAGDDPTIEDLEEWVKSNLRPLSLDFDGYSLAFSDELRAELTAGPLRCFQTFRLQGCAKPAFDEASATGLGAANNCVSQPLLIVGEAASALLQDKAAGAAGSGEANGSCEGSCGANAGSCWCDTYCTKYGDCCADVEAHCATSHSGSGVPDGGAAPTMPKAEKLSNACGDALSDYTARLQELEQLKLDLRPSQFFVRVAPAADSELPAYVGEGGDACPKSEAHMAAQVHKHGKAWGLKMQWGGKPAIHPDSYCGYKDDSLLRSCCNSARAREQARKAIYSAEAVDEAILSIPYCQNFSKRVAALIQRYPQVTCPTGSFKVEGGKPVFDPPDLFAWVTYLDTCSVDPAIDWVDKAHYSGACAAKVCSGDHACQSQFRAPAFELRGCLVATLKRFREYTLADSADGTSDVAAKVQASPHHADLYKNLESNRALTTKIALTQCQIAEKEAQVAAAKRTLDDACAGKPKPWTDAEASRNILPGHLDPSASRQFRGSGLDISVASRFANRLSRKGARFRVTLGPEARLTLAGTGAFADFGVGDMMHAWALVHAFSEAAATHYEMHMHAMDLDVFRVDQPVPSGFQLPPSPSFYRQVQRCRSYQVQATTVRVCGLIGGELGLDGVGGQWQGVTTTKPQKLSAKSTMKAAPFARLGATGSVGLEIGTGVIGVALSLDPLLALRLPTEAALELELQSKSATVVAARLTPSVDVSFSVHALEGQVAWYFDGRGALPDERGTLTTWSGITQLYELVRLFTAVNSDLAL